MDKPNNLGGSHELRDGGGNRVPLEEKCRQLTEECARLRAQLEEVQRERKEYLRALGFLLFKDEPVPSKEEVFASLEQGPPLEELIDQLEAELIARESGHA